VDFPRALSSYPPTDGLTLLQVLVQRIEIEPFNAIATALFALAILHTFGASRITRYAHRRPPGVLSEILHFFGEVEVVFGLWAIVLLVAMTVYAGWTVTTHYFNEGVNYTEPLFVVVIMALASTRPVVDLAERVLRRVAGLARGTPAAWWVSILIIGPLLGSFITEPAAMTVSALLLGRQFFNAGPSRRLRYATLGLLFVNVSIGGTLTHFAAPPVLMVSRVWEWDTPFMLTHFGWRAFLAILVSTSAYLLVFGRELRLLRHTHLTEREAVDPSPGWIIAVHVAFIAWTVLTAHHAPFFIGGFLIFLGFHKATAPHQGRSELRGPLLVGFFLAGLVIHGGLQAWWIGPILSRLPEIPLLLGATVLTAFNDNALLTYLATLVPNLDESLKLAVVSGAVVGGGLTVIANAPNPAGQTLLAPYFDDAVSPLGLLLGALTPTLVALAIFTL
jgi:hypothetical protein